MTASCDSSIKMGVFDPIRHLCELHELQFFVVLQSNSQPKQRFWSSSKLLNNLCGNLIYEFATYIDTSIDNSLPFPSQTQEEHLKSEVDDGLWIEKDMKREYGLTEHRVENINEDEDSVMLPEEEEEEIEEVLFDDGEDKHSDSIQALKDDFIETRKTYSKVTPVVCPPPITSFPASPPPMPPKTAEIEPIKTVQKGVAPKIIVQPTKAFFSPPPSETSAKSFLDDFDDADAITDSPSLVDKPNPITNPTIWKTYSFGRPLRQTTIDKLFKHKLASHARSRYSDTCSVRKLSNFEYMPLLLKILKKGNPYCVPYLKQLSR